MARRKIKPEPEITPKNDVQRRYNAMVTDECKAAYSRSFVNEYLRAFNKSWPYFEEMVELIKEEKTYLKPWFKDGEPRPAYESFEAYAEAELEPIVAPHAEIRERYRPTQHAQQADETSEDLLSEVKREFLKLSPKDQKRVIEWMCRKGMIDKFKCHPRQGFFQFVGPQE